MRKTILAAVLASLPAVASAQIYLPPGVGLPPQSVIGNTLSVQGNATAVTFSQLKSAFAIPGIQACPSSQWMHALAAQGLFTCTQPAISDISGLGTGVSTFLGTPNSANLAAAVTDKTGTGALVFGTAPTITLANGTGLPVSTGLSGLGTGVATFLGTPNSSNLATALGDGTGSGGAVFATSPTLVTPTIGAATATSVNKVAITAPATSATLTIANGKTLTANNTLTFSGTDSSTLNIGSGGTLAASATTDTTNASNISSGTLAAARLTALKMNSTTIDISATTSQVLSCGGMTPRAGVFFAAVATATNQVAFGMTDTTTSGEFHGRGSIATVPNYGTDTTVFDIIVDGSNSNAYALSSTDSSGFHLTPTKTGSPTGTITVKYLCIP